MEKTTMFLNEQEVEVKYTEVDGYTITSISGHPFNLSSGQVIPAQSKEVVDLFPLKRGRGFKRTIGPFTLYETRFLLDTDQLQALKSLSDSFDLVLVPLVVLESLREDFILDNVVAYNATEETRRLPPSEKVVDINNFSV